MNVVAVQQHFRELAGLVRQAGASAKVVDELNLIANGLDPFKERPLGTFVDFLRKAEEFDRTGILPIVPAKAKKPATPRATKPPKPAAADVIQRVVTLYQNILSPTLTKEAIEQELALIDSLKGAELQALASQLDVGEKVKKLKVKEKAAAIKQVVRDRRGMYQRPDF